MNLRERVSHGELMEHFLYLALDAEARSFSLPNADATDKLLRYEAHMDRKLYRAIYQLEICRASAEEKTCCLLSTSI